MKKPPIELRTLKPETTSKRLTRVHTGLKTNGTLLRNLLSHGSVDDIGHTEEGKKLRKEVWIVKQKLEGLAHWLARIRNDYQREESALRTDRRLKELNVDPEEVLNRDSH